MAFRNSLTVPLIYGDITSHTMTDTDHSFNGAHVVQNNRTTLRLSADLIR